MKMPSSSSEVSILDLSWGLSMDLLFKAQGSGLPVSLLELVGPPINGDLLVTNQGSWSPLRVLVLVGPPIIGDLFAILNPSRLNGSWLAVTMLEVGELMIGEDLLTILGHIFQK